LKVGSVSVSCEYSICLLVVARKEEICNYPIHQIGCASGNSELTRQALGATSFLAPHALANISGHHARKTHALLWLQPERWAYKSCSEWNTCYVQTSCMCVWKIERKS